MATDSKPQSTDALSSLRIDRTQKAVPKAGGRLGGWLVKFALLALLLLGGGALAINRGWLKADSVQSWIDVPDAIKQRPEYRVVKPVVEKGRAADATVVASGYLESRRQARIGARAVGRVQEVFVEEGSKVKKDDVLAVLEHKDLDASLAATEASLSRSKAGIEEQKVIIAQNKREYERAKGLLASRSISTTEYDKARFDLDSAEARLNSMKVDVELAQARLREAQQLTENMNIRAPFDGTVISRDAEVGESIMPGGMGEASGRGSAVTIADLDNLEVDCDVKEEYISRVVEGRSAEVVVDAVPNKRYRGIVRKIIPMGDRARATIKVKVTIVDRDERLFPNMSSTVYFLPDAKENQVVDEKPRMFIDENCLAGDEESTFVWVADKNDHVNKTLIKIGAKRDGKVEVLEGLKGSEKIVVSPNELKDDQAIKISQ
jgi:RND family efflux transporter MFP subunit